MRKRAVFLPKNSIAPMLLCAVFVFVVGVLLPVKVTATVFLPDYNKSFVSLTGLFGGQLSADENDPPIAAYLIMVPDQPYMCPDELKRIQPKPPFYSSNNNENTIDHIMMEKNQTINNNSMMHSNMMINNTQYDSSVFDGFGDIEPLSPPTDGLPVALLVERGMCTFYEKAAMASKYGPSVQYVIIYDDQIAPDLVPMSSEYVTDMTLLFVSASTGVELVDYIMIPGSGGGTNGEDENENEIEDSVSLRYDLVVELDGVSPVIVGVYPPLNMAAYFLAAMSGFLAFLIFFGCLLICAQCGCITAAPDEHGRIVLFAGGPGIRHTEGLARMICVDKLTREQVMILDEEEFEAPSDEGSGAGDEADSSQCCAICIDEFENKEKVRVLPCKHRFHEDCLVPWLTERHASCPLCKMDVLKYVQDMEEKGNTTSGESVDKVPQPIEALDGSPDDGSSTASLPSPRSFWFRLRGWSLIADSAPLETTGDNDIAVNAGSRSVEENTNDGSDTEERNSINRSLRVSEIEMETRETAAARGDAEMVMYP